MQHFSDNEPSRCRPFVKRKSFEHCWKVIELIVLKVEQINFFQREQNLSH